MRAVAGAAAGQEVGPSSDLPGRLCAGSAPAGTSRRPGPEGRAAGVSGQPIATPRSGDS